MKTCIKFCCNKLNKTHDYMLTGDRCIAKWVPIFGIQFQKHVFLAVSVFLQHSYRANWFKATTWSRVSLTCYYLSVCVVCIPRWPKGLLAPDVPHEEMGVVDHNLLHVASNCRRGVHHLIHWTIKYRMEKQGLDCGWHKQHWCCYRWYGT